MTIEEEKERGEVGEHRSFLGARESVTFMAVDIHCLVNRLKPAGGMVLAQLVLVGVNVFYKLAANDGMDLKVLVAYRALFGMGFMIPLALLVERYTLSLSCMRVRFQRRHLEEEMRQTFFSPPAYSRFPYALLFQE